MEDELEAARLRRLDRKIEQIVADFRRDFQWQQEQRQGEFLDPPACEPKLSYLRIVPEKPYFHVLISFTEWFHN
ncbi:MAG: hypothetical protein OSB66_09170 [SAR202 cluster bacterium]|nr:hypothetical protein [SAR202 cluster bacterium]